MIVYGKKERQKLDLKPYDNALLNQRLRNKKVHK